jgi:hypothetical protein
MDKISIWVPAVQIFTWTTPDTNIYLEKSPVQIFTLKTPGRYLPGRLLVQIFYLIRIQDPVIPDQFLV